MSIDPTNSDSSYLFGVIGERNRLRILAVLLDESSYVESIQKKLDIEATLLSKHLKALRDSGLVMVTRAGRKMLYELNPVVRKGRSKNSITLGCCDIVLKDI